MPEPLEDRRLLATLDIVAGALSYRASSGVVNSLTVTLAGTGTQVQYRFQDTGESITLGAGAVAAGWTSAGPNLVGGPDSKVSSISIDTKDRDDTVRLVALNDPTTVGFTNALGDLDTVRLGGDPANGARLLNGNITLSNAAGRTMLIADDAGDTTSRSPTIAGGTLLNLAPRPIRFAEARVHSIELTNAIAFGSLSINAGDRGPVTVEPVAGDPFGEGLITIDNDLRIRYRNASSLSITNAADQPLTPINQAVVVANNGLAVEGQAPAFLTASFLDADPNSRAGNFVATVDWGDGSPPAPAAIANNGLGRFDVTATHVYEQAGEYPVVVRVTGAAVSSSKVVGGIPVTISDLGGSALTTGPVTRTDLTTQASDPNLRDPWGIAVQRPDGPLWVADHAAGVATVYDGDGTPQPLVVTIPPPAALPGPSRPTGLAFNGTGGFAIGGHATTFLFATHDGTIAGRGPTMPGSAAMTAVDNHAAGARYTGLAILQDRLYVANFRAGLVEVFDSDFNPLGSFTDPDLPPGFAPYNVQALGGELYVTFARRDPATDDAVSGLGLGYVEVFSAGGALLRRLTAEAPYDAANAPLDAPWGLALAPEGFGPFAGALLVANRGDGRVNTFDPATGRFLGALHGPGTGAVAIDRLKGLAFGNGGLAGPADRLFFTANPGGGDNGLLGRLAAGFNRVHVREAALALATQNITAVEGQPFTGVVATFTDGNPLAQPEDFAATIHWGDGLTSPGLIRKIDGPGTAFQITELVDATHPPHRYIDPTVGRPPLILRVELTEIDGKGFANSAEAVGTATVNNARLLSTVLQPNLDLLGITEGVGFTETIVTFIDEDPLSTPADFAGAFAPVITWNDGKTSVGTVVQDPVTGVYAVIGTHVYMTHSAPGFPYQISVAIRDRDGATATAPNVLDVSDAPIVATALAVPTFGTAPIFESENFKGDVAFFTDANLFGKVGDFQVAIDWGDGTFPTTGGLTQDAAKVFHVTGEHRYLEDGIYPIRIFITDVLDGSLLADVTGSATVLDAKLTIACVDAKNGYSPTPVPAGMPVLLSPIRAGTAFLARVATITDANPLAPISDFAAGPAVNTSLGLFLTGNPGNLIDWGDGTAPSPALIRQPGGVGTPFEVYGIHTYATTPPAGSAYRILVTIADAGGRATFSDSCSAFVAPAPAPAGVLTPLGSIPLSQVEGRELVNVVVASFNDTDASSLATDFGAQVVWGDIGTPFAAEVVKTAFNAYDVIATHVYPTVGNFDISVSVHDVVRNRRVSLTNSATISDAPLSSIGAPSIPGVVGVPLRVTNLAFPDLATFTDENPLSSFNDFANANLQVAWGDGTVSNFGDGTVTLRRDGALPGVTYVVGGDHTYTRPGDFQIQIQVASAQGSRTVALSQAIVTATPLSPLPPVQAAGVVFTATEGVDFKDATVATFSFPDPSVGPVNFLARINWGDGSPVVNGTVVQLGEADNPNFIVRGSHSYAFEGNYAVTVEITDISRFDGSVAIASSLGIVADPALTILANNIAPQLAGSPFQGVLATFVSEDPTAIASEYVATIDWGDGSPISLGEIRAAGGGFEIRGSHTFTQAQQAPYQVLVILDDEGGQDDQGGTRVMARVPIEVRSPQLQQTSPGDQPVLQLFEGAAAVNVPVARFIDPNPFARAGDYVAQIDWGDGTTDLGSCSIVGGDQASGGVVVLVRGSHTYKDLVAQNVRVTVSRVDDPGNVLTLPVALDLRDAPIVVSVPGPVFVLKGEPVPANAHLATFTDANPFGVPADYTVTVNWGDGTPADVVVPQSLGGGVFAVRAGHLYVKLGKYKVTVTVTDNGGNRTIASSFAFVEQTRVDLASVAGGAQPKPSTAKPKPTTAKPKPSTVKPRPTTAKPKPTTAKPRPSTTKPRPNAAKPKPTTAKPKPTTAKPRPSTTKPRPSTAKPRTGAKAKPALRSAALDIRDRALAEIKLSKRRHVRA